MELYHAEERTYETTNPTIEFKKLVKDENLQFFSESNQIVFIHEGSVSFFYRDVYKKIKIGESILVALKSPCILTALEDTSLLIMRLSFYVNLQDYLPSKLSEYEGTNTKSNNVGFLKSEQKMMSFANILKEYINDGIIKPRFLDLKIQEFLCLISEYHSKIAVFNFLKPIYNRDSLFANNVYKYYDKVKTIQELAKMFGYHLSGFEKKFKRIFNTSPYRWMQQQRSNKVYYEVVYGHKTFTQLSSELGFSSPAHFNDFCKTYFKQTPGDLRKKNR